MEHVPIEETPVYRTACALADDLWDAVDKWTPFARRILGEQLLRAVESVAANLVEGDARFSNADAIKFFRYSRASARETGHWVSRALGRGLIDAQAAASMQERIVLLGKSINGLINYRSTKLAPPGVHEDQARYGESGDDTLDSGPFSTLNTKHSGGDLRHCRVGLGGIILG